MRFSYEKKRENEDYLISCVHITWYYMGNWKNNLKVIIGCFIGICKRKDLKVNADKKKWVTRFIVGGKQMENVLGLKYLLRFR